ncbi:MAG: carboxy terminal-processing peptidase [Bacteroidia bacterium]|nr:carboxy terminal-processing peptidase [Bacteroidia bacterium]
MKRFLKVLMLVVPVSLISLGFYLKNNDAGEEILLKVIVENLQHMHYDPLKVNNELSEQAFDNYLEYIDGNKRFLLASDVEELTKDRSNLDDQTLAGSYEFFDKSVNMLNERIALCKTYYTEILAQPMDFTVKETVTFDDELPYAGDEEALRERWRKYLKYNVMTRLATAIQIEKDKLNDDTNTEKIKSYDELEKDARNGVLKTHNDWFDRMSKLNRKDRLATYVNAITTLYDPHTSYFPPADKANFDIRMSGQLEGIGAQLQEKDGYIKVNSIVPGSPSAMQGELQANDLILKVGQGKEEPVDIVNARIDDAVKLIRGKKGTEVRLTVKKPDGTIKIIPIVRDVVQLEETYAKSVILNDESNTRVGYLNLPSFYADFNGKGGPTSWKDVRTELKKLNKEGAEALIFDLRNNGGGSLPDVVEIAGLFIDKGPIVQVKARNFQTRILEDKSSGVVWDKPVIFMVNEFSASASEILAAAMQDYGRGLIVGSHTTHGKGTVQQFIGLNQTLRGTNYPDLGALKITTQKFYRVDGGATQLKGVTPDIIWPDNYTYIKTGEKEQENSMSWDKIDAVQYAQVDGYMNDFNKIRKASEKRINGNQVFTEIDKNAKRWKQQRETKVFTLNLDEYQKETEERKLVSEAYTELFKPFEDLDISTLKVDQEAIGSDTVKQKRADDWHKRLKKDVYLYESLQIAEDLTKADGYTNR